MLVDITVELNDMRQQHRICASVRNMECCSKLVCHSVVQSQRRRIECKTCQTGCRMHLLSCMSITSVQICSQQENSADFNCFSASAVAKSFLSVLTHASSAWVNTSIPVSAVTAGGTLYKFCIQNCLIRCQISGYQRIFSLLCRIRYNCKRGHLWPRTACRRNRDQPYITVVLNPHCKFPDWFGRINGRTPPTAIIASGLYASNFTLHWSFQSADPAQHPEKCHTQYALFQWICDQIDHTALCQKRVCNNQYFLYGISERRSNALSPKYTFVFISKLFIASFLYSG